MDRQRTQPFLEDLDFGRLSPSGENTGRVRRFATIHEEYKCLLEEEGAVFIDEKEELQHIYPEDTLIVVDLQVDFLPGGTFAVPEGDQIVSPVCALVKRFMDAEATIYCSRDYHPVDHCSFSNHGGHFPSHCVQGTRGSHFADELKELIQHKCHPLVGPVFIVYKGFSPDVDSFGAVPYDQHALQRSPRVARRMQGHCASTWTGSFLLFSSNVQNDCNAPPDVMSVLHKRTLPDHQEAAVHARNGKVGRLFVVGLALDYCVLDTAVNAAQLPNSSEIYSSVSILVDYCRPAHSPDFLNGFGSGFFTRPRDFAVQVEGKVRLLAAIPPV